MQPDASPPDASPVDESSRPLKLGEILVQQGVLSEQQVFEVLQEQKRRPAPFGVLAERMFDVTISSIEDAWVEQYHRFTGTLDLNDVAFDEEALRLLHRRQAHQFEMMPVRFEPGGELLLAATRQRMARAVTFATANLDRVAFFRVAERDQLRTFLQKHYPMPEVSDELIAQARRIAG